ncbi:MAG TPA: HAD family phosphatase [Isosphaeraceae bacterium]|jgi:HAD superfamily hydrolase (TIGR01509 family)|nr:HAD family phosphatase [Isosphaeraceae bacterium]
MHDPIRAVVFDLDGLMFDTEALYFRVAGEMLAARGKEFTPAMMRLMIGRRAAEVTAELVAMAELEESVEDVLAETRARFYALMDTAVHPTPGLFVLLDNLGQKKLPLAVATSSRRSYAEGLLESHGLLARFAFLLTSEDVTRGKPDPEIYRLAAERFGLPTSSVLVLEDSPAGVAAGKAAGAFTIAIPHEHSPAEDLAAADLVAPRLDDPRVLAIVEGDQR